ncbi:MAG: DsbA family protein [Patescibacteria group bacterium]
MKHFFQKMGTKQNFNKIILPILLILILVLIGYFSFKKTSKNLNETQARTKVEAFVNGFLMSGGNKATIKEVTSEYGLYKFKIDIVSSIVESYLTKDGKFFFPQALDVEKISSGKGNGDTSGANQTAPSSTVSKKSDKPKIELFVMSYCPYGTQIEKGILPVVEALGKKIDFELKFCNYAMHGDKELAENMTQYCINTEQPAKFNPYLSCFLAAGDSASCLASTGVDKNKVATCVAKTDTKYKITENAKNKVGYQGSYPGFDIYKADNAKYNVGGSPTLIINGEEIQSGRDSASLLKTICSAFNNEPKECQTVLSSASPAPGFGTGTQAAGSGSAAAGCATN